MAVEMVDEIKKHNEKGEKTVFICPVGPVGQYPYFVDMVNEQNISLKNVWFPAQRAALAVPFPKP